jgi:hypothetical protein
MENYSVRCLLGSALAKTAENDCCLEAGWMAEPALFEFVNMHTKFAHYTEIHTNFLAEVT